MTAKDFIGKVEHEKFFRDLAPRLHTTGARKAGVAPAADVKPSIEREGYFVVPGLLRPDEADALRDAVDALAAANVPALFVFVYDEAWNALSRARDLVRATGTAYDLLADVWAWRIPLGARGWDVHRGTSVDAREGWAPAVLNLWIPLSDVSRETAAIHLVPLDRDPHYPRALDKVDFDPARVVALAASRGALMGWNSNVLHWGGPMTAQAPEPRRSISVSLVAPFAKGLRAPETQTFRDRLDLIADMITTYGTHEGPDLDDAREWAQMVRSLRSLGRSRL